MVRPFLLAIAIGVVWTGPGWAQSDEEIAQGRALSEEHCARCHVVGDFNPMGGIGSTPSFQLLVNRLPDWEERFQTFHVRLPHPSVVRVTGFPYPDPRYNPPAAEPFEIELDDISRIMAFARTLKED